MGDPFRGPLPLFYSFSKTVWESGGFVLSHPVVQYAAICLWTIALFLSFAGTIVAFFRVNGRRTRSISSVLGALPPVTILKPLKGVDDGFEENIRTFLELDYPDYELYFCVGSPLDPAYSKLVEVLSKFPSRAKRVICTSEQANVGPNPKINNLVPAYELTKTEYTVISDSNVRITPKFLRDIVSYDDTDVVVVSGFVAGILPQGFGGLLECMYLNTFYARFMVLLAALGVPQVVGKALLFKKSFIDSFGGISCLGRYLAEDNVIGQWAMERKKTVWLMKEPSYQYVGKHAVRDFWQRHIRWGRLRKSIALPGFLLETVTYPALSLVFALIALPQFFALSLWTAFCVHVSLHYVSDLLLYYRVLGGNSGGGLLRASFAWFVREALAIPMWIHVASGNTVNWRGTKLRVFHGGELEDPKSNVAKIM